MSPVDSHEACHNTLWRLTDTSPRGFEYPSRAPVARTSTKSPNTTYFDRYRIECCVAALGHAASLWYSPANGLSVITKGGTAWTHRPGINMCGEMVPLYETVSAIYELERQASSADRRQGVDVGLCGQITPLELTRPTVRRLQVPRGRAFGRRFTGVPRVSPALLRS